MNRHVIVALLIGILIGSGTCCSYFLLTEQSKSWHHVQTHAKELAYSYLVNSYNSTLGLCYVHPEEKNVYWVTHDNVLASYVLQSWNRKIADNITETVRRIARDYNLTISQVGIPLDTRAEILLGYNTEHFFNETENVILNASYYGSILMTERATNEILTDFEAYMDLLCYASLVEWRNENYTGADYYYEEAKKMWDGNGFADEAFHTHNYYATYKLGLFYFINKMLGKGSFEFEKELIQQVWQCQDCNGGFKTDYYGDGSFPLCYTNTETTSIILLADIPLTSEVEDKGIRYQYATIFIAVIGVLVLFIYIFIKIFYKKS